MNPQILMKKENLKKCFESIEVASKEGAKLIVFPECSLTGYCFTSLEEAMVMAETIPGPSVNALASLCEKLELYTVVGILEREDDKCFNSIVLLGPDGIIGKYRKLHLPFLGVDRFITHGNLPLKVFDTAVGKIGMNICFDSRFPEPARIMLRRTPSPPPGTP